MTKKRSNNSTPQVIHKEELDISGIIEKRIRLKCRNEKQKEYANLITNNEIVICVGPAGTGKAQPLTSKILTPNGWTTMGEIQIGDDVISRDGKPTKVTGVFPQGVRPIYRVSFNDGSSTDCDGEHLWYTETYNDRNHRKRDSNGKRYSSPRKGSVKTTLEIKESLLTNSGRKNHSIPMVEPIEFKKENLLIDPYVMGCLLGDGSFTKNKVILTNINEELINLVEDRLPKETLIEKIPSHDIDYCIKSEKSGVGQNKVLNEIRFLGLDGKKSNSKFIPVKYLFSDINDRISLLQGLMDTDGTIDKRSGSLSYTTVSKKLMDGVKSLVESLGGTCKITEKQKNYTYKGVKKEGQLSYNLAISLKDIEPFKVSVKKDLVITKTKYKPKRFITSIEYIGEEDAQCIMVDNPEHLYVTDDYIVTHNTHIAIARAIELLQNKTNKYDKLIICKPAIEAGEKLGFLPGTIRDKMAPIMESLVDVIDKLVGKDIRITLEEHDIIKLQTLAFIRGKTIDNAILVLDEAQNMTNAQIKTVLTRIGANSKFIISGDLDQSDLFNNFRHSGLYDAWTRHKNIPEIGFFEFDETDIVRNPIISKILNNYKIKEKKETPKVKPTDRVNLNDGRKTKVVVDSEDVSKIKKENKNKLRLRNFLNKFHW